MAGRRISSPFLVVVHDLNIGRAIVAGRPFEADPPLLIDSDAVLTCPVALERLKTIARQATQIPQRGGGRKDVQPFPSLTFETLELTDEFTFCKAFRPAAPVAQDHFGAS